MTDMQCVAVFELKATSLSSAANNMNIWIQNQKNLMILPLKKGYKMILSVFE